MPNIVTIVIILAIGYLLGVKFPALAAKIGVA